MKIFKVAIGRPWMYGSDDETVARAATIDAKEAEFIAKLNGAYNHSAADYWDSKTYIMNESAMLTAISELGIKEKQRDQDGTDHIWVKDVEFIMDIQSPMDAITHAVNKLELAARRLEDVALAEDDGKIWGGGWNAHTGSPVSGTNLLHINELMLCQDCCTDRLQDVLSDGWRLIAVCPQESRRPDYVLGRHNQELEKTNRDDRPGSALRG